VQGRVPILRLRHGLAAALAIGAAHPGNRGDRNTVVLQGAGIVEAIGDGKPLEDGGRAKFQVRPGDRVLFSSYAGTEVKVDGDELLVMGEEDILATVQN